MAHLLNSQGSLAGTVDATAEEATLVDGVTYPFRSDSNCVIRYTTAGGTAATATPAAGDILVTAGAEVLVRLSNSTTRLSVVRRTADGVYTLTPIVGG